MNTPKERRKKWKRGLSLLLAVLTVLNLSSQGLILTAQALGRGEVEAPEIGVTFSPEQLPGSMANQVSDRVYMLPTKAEMSLQVTVQPGYTSGYATGGYVRLELPYFYVNDAGQIIITDKKPSFIDESKLMGIEARVVGDTGNWVVDTTQGELSPLPVQALAESEQPIAEEPAQQPEAPVVNEAAQKPATPDVTEMEQKPAEKPEVPVPTEPEQKPVPPAVTEPEAKPEPPAEADPVQKPDTSAAMEDAPRAVTSAAAEPEQQPDTSVPVEPEQPAEQPDASVPTELEQKPETPAAAEPVQQPEAPAVAEPEHVVEQPAVAAPTAPEDDGEGYRRGVLQLIAANDSVHMDSKPISFTVTLRFFGDVPENVAGSVLLGAGYAHYHDAAGNVSTDGYQIAPGSSSEKDIHAIDIVNSNLQWEYSVEQVGKSVIWDKYNYITYHVKVSNTSGKDTTSRIDKFTLILTVQSYQNTPGEGGVLEEDMMQWEYQPGGDPIRNEDYSPNSRDKVFVGVPNEGGVLVHDVTDMTAEERAQLDLTHFSNLGETLPYKYSLPGVIGVDISGEKGTLYPEHLANGADKRSYREYYISVPYTNNLRGKMTTGTYYRPTIYFGGRNVPWTKQTEIIGEFVKRAPSFTHEKYVLGEGGTKQENKPVGLGDVESYYLDGFQNTGNLPAFSPIVTDTMPDKFAEKHIDLILDPDAEGKPREMASCFAQEPLDFVFQDAQGELHYVTAADLGVSPTLTVDPETQVATYSYYIDQVIASYLENRDWTFTRQFRVHLREEIAAGEALPCRVAVAGGTPSAEHWSIPSRPTT